MVQIGSETLSAETHAAGVWIVWRASRNGEHAGPRGDQLILGGGRGDLGSGGGTGESEDDDESPDKMFHGVAP
jgi:hypothetical protein